tara:strand:+ start:168 stop:353 length:186 start_codon:yes stop_codon:yes gene_type:complete
MNLKSIWVNTQSLLFASLTIVGTVVLIIAGIALLPITILLVAIFVLFVIYKVVISDDEPIN